MTAPSVTIAIPFLNSMPSLQMAVASVLNQTYPDFELLLIDDGSTDSSVEYVRSIRDSRVRVIVDGANRRLSARLNQAAERASGEFLYRMDADDVMFPTRVEEQLAVLRGAGPNVVVGSQAVIMDEERRIIGLAGCSSFVQRTGYAARRSFIHPTVAARTAWFRRNPYSTRSVFQRCEDAELWVRTSADSVFRCLERPLLFYRDPQRMAVDKYLSSAMGMAILASQAGGRYTAVRVARAGRELLKGWVALAATEAGCGRYLVRNRYHRIDAEARDKYECLLRRCSVVK